MKTIGERVMNLRGKRRLSQRNVALRTGITHSTISRIEDGISAPSTKNLQLLADFFKVSTDYLLTGNKEQEALSQQYPEKYDKLFQKLSLLPESDFEIVSSIVSNFLDKQKEINRDKKVLYNK